LTRKARGTSDKNQTLEKHIQGVIENSDVIVNNEGEKNIFVDFKAVELIKKIEKLLDKDFFDVLGLIILYHRCANVFFKEKLSSITEGRLKKIISDEEFLNFKKYVIEENLSYPKKYRVLIPLTGVEFPTYDYREPDF